MHDRRLAVAAAVLTLLLNAGSARGEPDAPALHDGAHDFDFEIGT